MGRRLAQINADEYLPPAALEKVPRGQVLVETMARKDEKVVLIMI
jgi:hypothetical protein